MKRRALWALVLLIPMTFYTLGAAHGNPRRDYAPSLVQTARLNGATVFHPDEFAYVGLGYHMLLNRTWDPDYYHNPPLNIYSNMALFWLGQTTRMPHDMSYGTREIAPFQLYVMARYLSALYTLLTVSLLFAAGRIAFGRRAGYLAATVAAFSPLVTQHAHYATPNAETTMLFSAALLLALILVTRERVRWPVFAAAGLLVGLTMATRYNAAAVGIITGPALLIAGWRERRWEPVVLGFALMPVGLVLGLPGIVLEPGEVEGQIQDIMRWYREAGGGGGFTSERGLPGMLYHWRYLALAGVGPGALLAALVGLVVAWRRGRSQAWIAGLMLVFMVVYTVLALPGRRLQANLLFPLIPPLALLAGAGIVGLWQRSGHRRAVAFGLIVLVLAWPVLLSGLFTLRIDRLDNRLRAQNWIYQHIPRGTAIFLLGSYNVPLDPLDYAMTQTYKSGASAEDVRQSSAAILVYSDAGPHVILRDPALTPDPADVAQERAIRDVLASDWIELARFERLSWPLEDVPPDDVSYWHQMEIVIYCNPANCPVGGVSMTG